MLIYLAQHIFPMISSISLGNWRSHESTAMDFSSGTNLLVGIMGSGKSTILDALCFALYGTFPQLQRGKLTLSEVVMFGNEEAEVELKFSHNGNDYSVKRAIKKRGTDAQLYKNGKLAEKSSRAVTKEIENELKVDYDLFTRAIYSEQNRIDYFLTLDPRRRKGEVDELLGLDRFEKARSSITTLVNRISSLRQMLEKEYDRERIAEIARKVEESGDELGKRKSEFKSISEKSASLEKSLSEKQAEKEEIEKKKDKYYDAKEEITKASSWLNVLEKEISDFRSKDFDFENEQKKLESLEDKKSQIEKSLNDVRGSQKELYSRIGSLENQLKSSLESEKQAESAKKELERLLDGKSIPLLKETFSKKETKLQETRERISILKNSIREAELSLKELKEERASCPVCSSSLSPEKISQLRKEKSSGLHDAQKELEGKNELFLSLESEHEQAREKISRAESLGQRIKDIGETAKDISKTGEELDLLRRKQEELSKMANENEKEIGEIEKKKRQIEKNIEEYREMEKKKQKRNELKEKLFLLEKKLSEIDFHEEKFEKKKEELSQIKVSLESAKGKKELAQKEIENIEGSMKEWKDELKRMEKKREDISYYSEKEEQLIIYKNALVETQMAARNELIEAINAALEEIWQIVYPYRDYTKVRMRAEVKDYVFEIYSDEWRSLDAVASGGERACLCLALRVAFAMVLTPNLSWLILDEPTHNLDQEAVDVLATTLQERIPQIVDQVFVITHDPSLLEANFGTAYRLSREKEKNEPTKAEKL